jgi:hypothetical protein
MKTGFIYIWYDSKRKMYYIGCHWGTENDGYICSSRRMRDAYRRRPQDFKKRIIQKNIDRDNLLSEEHKWLQLISDEELGEKYYNLHKHHFGHWSIDNRTNLTIKQKLSEASKKLHQNQEYREKFLEGRKNLPPRSEEAKRKTAIANTGKKRTEETKRKISESNRGKVLGPLSDEHRKKVSESLKGEKNPFYGKQHDPELKKQMNAKTSTTMKGRPPNYAEWMRGTFWWNYGTLNKRSEDCPGNDWNRGTVK